MNCANLRVGYWGDDRENLVIWCALDDHRVKDEECEEATCDDFVEED